MPIYAYTARDKDGKVINGTQEAASEYAAIKILQTRDLILTKINDASSELESQRVSKSRQHKRVRSSDLLFFVRQLAILLDAGIPILRSIDMLFAQVQSEHLASTVDSVKADIKAGITLRDAVSKHPKVFPTLWVYLIEAGETSGNLPLVLNQLADHLESSMNLRKKVVSALIYPAVLLIVAFVALLIFLLKIIPVFSNLFNMFHAKLPPITLIVIGVSTFLQHFIVYIVLGIALLVYLLKRYIATPHGRRDIDKKLIAIPLIGGYVRDSVLVRITINLSTLLQSGVNLLRSLEIASQTAGNTLYQAALNNVAHDVKQGKPLSFSLNQSRLFPPMMIDMITVGEESGTLPNMLTRLAKYYEDRVETFTGRLGTLIEPIILIGVGSLIGFLVVSIFLPIFSLSTVIK